jgi:photosystem II stability/assembly factor-like uncharacterized protein
VVGGFKRDAAVWRSTDHGVSWEEASGEFGGRENQEIKDVVAVTNGRLVAVGYDNDSGHAAVWISADDGQTWGRRFEISATEDTEQMAGAVAGDFGLIAVGNEGSSERKDAAVWKSTNNGRAWKRLARADFDLPGAQEMTSVIATDLGLLAVGSDKSSGQQRAAVWRSTDDGESWRRSVASELDAEDGAGMTSVTEVGGAVFGLGQAVRGAEGDAAVWRIGTR